MEEERGVAQGEDLDRAQARHRGPRGCGVHLLQHLLRHFRDSVYHGRRSGRGDSLNAPLSGPGRLKRRDRDRPAAAHATHGRARAVREPARTGSGGDFGGNGP